MKFDKENMRKVLRYRWVIFTILAFAYFFVYFHRVSTAVVADDISGTFGVGAASIGLLGSAYFYAYTAMQLPSGVLTDKWGIKRTAAVFTLLAAVGALLTGVSTSFEMVVFGRLLIGIGVAMVYIPIIKVLAVWFRKSEFATISGAVFAIGNIGALSAAGPLAIATTLLGSWQAVFLALGIFTVLMAIAIWILVKETPEQIGGPSLPEIEAYERGEVYTEQKEAQVKQMPMMEALKKTFGAGRKFWPLSIWFFLLYGTLMVYQGLWAGPFFRDVLSMDKSAYSGVLSLIAVGMIIGCPVAGYLSDKVMKSRKKVLILGTTGYLILWIIIWAIAGKVSDIMIYSVIHILFGFFGGFLVVSYAQIKDWFPASIVGTATGAFNVFPFLGGAILMSVTGKLMEVPHGVIASVDQYKFMWLLMVILMAIGLVCLILSKEKKPDEDIIT